MPLNQSDEGKPRLNPEQLELAQKLKDELDKDKPAAPAVSKLAELQAAARQVQTKSETEKWSDVVDYDYKKIPPPTMALLYKDLGLGTLAQCLALALERWETGKNPLKGHIYILPSGRIGTSLEGLLIDMKNQGIKLGKPRYENTTRPWRKGIVLSRRVDKGYVDVTEKDFDGKEPGKICRMTIDGEEVEHTCWLTEWFMGGNPNWWNRMNWMLEVRAQMNCIKLGSGASISEEIVDDGGPSLPAPKVEPKAPNEVPFAAGK